jgi:hypothetical protein
MSGIRGSKLTANLSLLEVFRRHSSGSFKRQMLHMKFEAYLI